MTITTYLVVLDLLEAAVGLLWLSVPEPLTFSPFSRIVILFDKIHKCHTMNYFEHNLPPTFM